MTRKLRRVVFQVTAPLLVALMSLACLDRAEASLGDSRLAVDIPLSAQCGGTSGTAVTMVPGGKAGFPKIAVLLVTSCITGGQAKLFFLNPATNPATLVTTINTSVNPLAGWGALGLRADQGDLIACTVVSAGTTDIYSIAFSPFNTTPAVGTATLLRRSPVGSATCTGIAWDPQTKTIYQSSSTSNVLHFPATGTSAGTPIPSGCTAGVGGVGVAGKSLLVGCQFP